MTSKSGNHSAKTGDLWQRNATSPWQPGRERWKAVDITQSCSPLPSGFWSSYFFLSVELKRMAENRMKKKKKTTIDWVHKKKTSKQKASWKSWILGKCELFNTSWNIVWCPLKHWHSTTYKERKQSWAKTCFLLPRNKVVTYTYISLTPTNYITKPDYSR